MQENEILRSVEFYSIYDEKDHVDEKPIVWDDSELKKNEVLNAKW